MDRKNVAAVYELTPMQQGMFFHSRYGGDGEVYFTQFQCRIEGELDVTVFRHAWQRVLRRHPVLRSTFHWQKLDKPLQVVHREAKLPVEVFDWRRIPADRQDAELDTFLAADRARGFDLGRVPLMRLALLRRGDGDHHLVWSHHHLLLDGWSVGLVLQEVLAFYQALSRGREPELASPRPYKDFILWLQRQDLAEAEAYWRGRLRGMTPTAIVRELPAAAGAQPGYRRFARTFNAAATARLEALARRRRLTLNTLFQGAWALYLHRSGRQDDVVFGAVTSGRPTELQGVEGMIGMFINTLPVRVEISRHAPAGDWLAGIQEQQSRSRRYEHAPLVRIRAWSDVPSEVPLFESLVIFENLPGERSAEGNGGLAVRSAGFVQRTNYPLTLAISPRGETLWVRIVYSTRHFSAAAVARILRQLETWLLAAAADPEAPLERISPLRREERHQVLTEWNDSRREPTGDATVHDLVAAQASRTPQATAVVAAGREVSYRELAKRSGQLARRLLGWGIGPDQLVAVCAERSLDMVAAVLGVLEAGAAYLPLDPAYPDDRLRFTLADSGARLVLTQSRLGRRFTACGARVVLLDEGDTAEPDATPGAVPRAVPGNLAYVIYTSGSTGRPKGVSVEHRTLVDRVRSMIEFFELGPGHRQLQFVSLGFDMACEEIFTPLACGAAVVVEPDIQARTPSEVLEACGRLGVTKLNVPASYWHQLVDELEIFDLPVPDCLEILATGAESPSPQKLLQWRARAPAGSRFFNGFGPTEATIMCSTERVEMTPGELARCDRLPIGRRLVNTTLYLLDAGLRALPVGATGELFVGGYGVTRGYLARAGLSAERFLPDPFAAEPGARLYRTGDLVRFLGDGRLEFAGRVDHQVKLRGFRIELPEIEQTLRRHPEIGDAAVLLREDRLGDRRLVAYVVAAGAAAEIGLGELRRFLGESLPEHMVPGSFVVLDAMPLNASNKLDRAALPAPGSERPDLETEYVAPRTGLESFLAELWRDVLGVERVGIFDSFFELGGDSLKGAVFINRVEAKLEEYVYVVALFDSPTVAGFAAYLGGHSPAAVERHFGAESVVSSAERQQAAAVASRLDAGDLRRVRELVEPLPAFEEASPERNPPAVFMLSPPRSGSTLFRVILAGHPGLFAPPELDLLSFNTLTERKAAFSGRYSFWLEGTLRALMEIEGCDADEARRLMEDCETRGLSTLEFYRFLQKRLRGRLLVDKTPSYALDLEVLRRAESGFENVRFIHLLRHPCGMIRSFEKARIDELFFRYEHPYTPRQLGELVWDLCHENILDFFGMIPAERKHRVCYEELVADPERVLGGVCEFLGLELEPAMLDPYADQPDRMTDGIHPLAKMLGDVKFHEHRKIDPRAAWRWQEDFEDDFLGEMTWELARSLGYDKPPHWRGAERPAPIELLARDSRGGGRFAVSFGQKRLWVLDRLAPGSAGYNIPAAVRVRGRLDAAALADAFADLVARHETLRTRFTEADGEPWQVVEPPSRPDFVRVDVENRPEEAARLAADEMARPFDLEHGPLLRVRLLRRGDDDHTLLVNLHHIVSDGWSQAVLVRELVHFYEARVTAAPSALPELAVQYADFAAWQNAWLTGPRLEEQIAVWRRRLDGAPALLELPTDRPRPAVRGFGGARRRVSFGRGQTEALGSHGRERGATLFMTLLAAFATALARHSGQTDVLVGSPVAGRGREELEGLIGFFVNTLVLRTDLSGNPAFSELLDRVRTVTLEALRYQDVPFEKLVEELRPERSTSRQPLFQVAFALQNAPASPLSLSELVFEPVEADSASAKFDLTLSLTETPRGLEGSLEYATDIFDTATVERFRERLGHLLARLAEDPQQRIGHVPLVSQAKHRQLVEDWPGDGRAVAAEVALPKLFEARVAEQPSAVALTWGESSLAYDELDRRANRLAHHLRRLGVEAEVPVGLYLSRSPELVVAVLAILKAGGAYLPVDPVYPPERVRYMLEDAGAEVVITEEALAEALPPGRRLVRLDADAPAIDAESAVTPKVGIAPDQLAYAIYTSGSTGHPKGTLVTHRHVGRLLAATEPWFGFGRGDVWTLFHSIAFDFSVWEIWGALAYGGRLVVVPHEISRSPRAFTELLEREDVTVLNQTPSAFRQLMAEEQERGSLDAPLAWVIFGGEALDVGSLEPWWRRHGDTRPRLVNMYGITETTVHVSYRPLEQGDLAAGWRSIVGRGIPDLELYVIDRWGEPAPAGVPGEIRVGGGGVARGYLGRPRLTAERFAPHPFARYAGARLYRSGDLGRWLPHRWSDSSDLSASSDLSDSSDDLAELEYFRRLDHQVKVRGFRIELGEIEAVLEDHAAVARAVVLPHDYDGGDRRLVAYVVPDKAEAAPLRRRLALEGRHGAELFELTSGLSVVHLNRSETEFLEREIFDDNAYLRHGIALGDGDTVFDVGANIGMFSLQAAQHGARVYAFEPIPPVHEVLRRNFELYGLAGRAFDCALAEQPGTARFTYYPQVSVISGRHAAAEEEREVVRTFLLHQDDEVSEAGLEELLDQRLQAREIDCPLKTVSQVLRDEGLERVDLLKVDVEKSELEVLLGIDDDDWPKIRQVVVEVHDLDGRLERVRRLLEGHGFELVVEEDPQLRTTGLYSLYARRPEERRSQSAVRDPGWSSPRRLEEALRAAARERLPEYMVPAACVVVEALPLTANGKLDRAALKRLPLPGRDAARGGHVAPRDDLERDLAALFERLLGSGPVGVGDDFFELGGHSLLAVRLMAEIRGRHGRDLPLATLFQGGTVERLAAEIRSAEGQARSPLVELQRGRDGLLPLFCVHPAGGNVLCYTELARALGPERPVYGLEARGLAAGETPRRRIDSMAEAYLEAVREARPEGPYALLGWSLGGLVAYEMACRLRAAGEPVALLAVLDVWARAPNPHRFTRDAEMLAEALELGEPESDESDMSDKSDKSDKSDEEQLAAVMRRAETAGLVPAGFDLDQARRFLAVFSAGREAAAAYEPPSYPGAMTLFRATDQPPAVAAADETLGWRRYVAGKLEVHLVSGSHRTLVRPPHVRELVEPLTRIMMNTRTAAPAPAV